MMPPKTPPTFATQRLFIRPLSLRDLTDYHRVLHSDPEVMRYLPGGVPRTREQSAGTLRYLVEHGEYYGYSFEAVCDIATGALMGHVGLHKLYGAVEVGYALGRAYWGQGYATEAAHAMLSFGFETVGLEEIIALAYAENVASQRVMQRLGMTHAGETDAYYNARLVLYRLSREAFR
jgi:RimJ/RimL family protein N-acetyltransferase